MKQDKTKEVSDRAAGNLFFRMATVSLHRHIEISTDVRIDGQLHRSSGR